MSHIDVLMSVDFPDGGLKRLADRYRVHYVPSLPQLEQAIGEVGEHVRAVVTSGGTVGLNAAQIARLPKLELILSRGAGFDRIDVEAARQRGIAVATGQSVNGFSVADHAFALLLALVRDTGGFDRAVRSGAWTKARTERPVIFRKRLGILGLGDIGSSVARRGLGFDMTIGYHNRSPRTNVNYTYYRDPVSLASSSDILVATCPGGPSTQGIIDEKVLDALGPSGILVNVARGSVVKTEALIDALSSGRIAGAALDVIDGEPAVPPELLAAPNLLITPHVGALSPESLAAAVERVVENLDAHFAGRPLVAAV